MIHFNISDHIDVTLLLSLAKCTFFSTLNEVWASKNERFEDHESFVRRQHVADAENRYMNTVLLAAQDNLSAANNSVESEDTSDCIDTFGLWGVPATLAHLLPNKGYPDASSLWFPIVPWVLHTGNKNLEWAFLQKCIHGTLQDATNETDKGMFRRVFNALTQYTGTWGRNDVKRKSTPIKSSTSKSGKASKSNIVLVGIKHFPANRIRLVDHQSYFDRFPCVIIVPIMSVEEARSWNGGAYDAIFLAGDWECDNIPIDAASVYRRMQAKHNMYERNVLNDSCLASEEQCIIACHLLKQMILSVCDSATSSAHLLANLDTSRYEIFDEWKRHVTQLHMAPVPISNRWENGSDAMKVRKVTFSTINRVPDPVLLLAKAASNWLKRHQIGILPTCGDDDDNDDDDDDYTNDSGSGHRSVHSYTSRTGSGVAKKRRGWVYHMFATAKKPRTGITEVHIRANSDTVDEPLSDDDS